MFRRVTPSIVLKAAFLFSLAFPTNSFAEPVQGQYTGVYKGGRTKLEVRVDATNAGTRLHLTLSPAPNGRDSGTCNYVTSSTLSGLSPLSENFTKVISVDDLGQEMCPAEVELSLEKGTDGLVVDISRTLGGRATEPLPVPTLFEKELGDTTGLAAGAEALTILDMHLGMTKAEALETLGRTYDLDEGTFFKETETEVLGQSLSTILLVPGFSSEVASAQDPLDTEYAWLNDGGDVNVFRLSFIGTGEDSRLFDIIRANYSHGSYLLQHPFGFDRGNIPPTQDALQLAEGIVAKYLSGSEIYAQNCKSLSSGSSQFERPDLLCFFAGGYEVASGALGRFHEDTNECEKVYPSVQLLSDYVYVDLDAPGAGQINIPNIAVGSSGGNGAKIAACPIEIAGSITAVRLGNRLEDIQDLGVSSWNIRVTDFSVLGSLQRIQQEQVLQELAASVADDLSSLTSPTSEPAGPAPKL